MNTNELFPKVIGYDKIKSELAKVLNMIHEPEKYKELGAKLPHGVLLFGPPGTGKTLLAKSFIEAAGLPSYTVRKNKGGDGFVDSIAETFEEAGNHAPAIVFLDDMDKFSNSDERCCDTEEYVTIQACIDDVKDKDVFVIATVNEWRKLPQSLKREGRFDIKICCECPNEKDAAEIVKYYLSEKPIAGSVNMDDFTKMISYSTCAKLETLINNSAIHAAYADKEKIEMEDLVQTVLKDEYSFESGDDLNREKDGNEPEAETILAMRKNSLHEAAHLVVSDVLVPGSVGLAAINSDPFDSGAYGGLVHRCKEFTRRPYHILVALAGKVAVELEYADTVASGAHSDMSKAFTLIREAISASGTAGIGMLDVAMERFPNSSESFNSRNEAVTQAEMERYLLKTREILLKNREYLNKVTEELLEKKVLLNSDVKRIRESVTITEVAV